MPTISNNEEKKYIRQFDCQGTKYFIRDEMAQNQIVDLEERLDRIETVVQVLNNTINNLIINK